MTPNEVFPLSLAFRSTSAQDEMGNGAHDFIDLDSMVFSINPISELEINSTAKKFDVRNVKMVFSSSAQYCCTAAWENGCTVSML